MSVQEHVRVWHSHYTKSPLLHQGLGTWKTQMSQSLPVTCIKCEPGYFLDGFSLFPCFWQPRARACLESSWRDMANGTAPLTDSLTLYISCNVEEVPGPSLSPKSGRSFSIKAALCSPSAALDILYSTARCQVRVIHAVKKPGYIHTPSKHLSYEDVSWTKQTQLFAQHWTRSCSLLQKNACDV